MKRLCLLWAVFLLPAAPALVYGQGLLVVVDPDQVVRLPRPVIVWPPPPPIVRPEPPTTYKIKQLEVNARLADQVAQVQVSQSFTNTGSRQLEVAFVFPLPYDGAIDSMTLMVDGKEYAAELLKADEARRLYEQIVRKNQDPALLEWMGTGLFKTSVFPVPAGQSRTVTLRYSQLCRKQDGLTDFLFPLSTAKYTSHAVEEVRFRVTIESGQEIKNIYSPSHSVQVKRADDHHATVTYATENEVPTTDFRLFYGVGEGELGARVLSYRPEKDDEGYFLLLAGPKIEAQEKERPKKTVVFVVDRSGSMTGEKIEQARGALKFVLNNLRKGDLFNIVAYDSEVESFRPELQRFNDDARKEALGFVEGIYAGGSTNINAALGTALALLQDTKRPAYVIFLTDGLPTVGETNEMKIVDNAKEANDVRARVFAFGVGYDVNSRLLDKLVRENFGQSQYVRPDEDIEDSVSRLYRRIESPVMTDVKIDLVLDEKKAELGNPISRVYPKGSFDLFAGEQLVVVGRYKRAGAVKVVVRGAVDGNEQKFDFPAKLAGHSGDESNAFVEKLWAVRRVGEILDELDLKGKNEELVEELVKLSTRHGILTPYTSFLADENTRIQDTASHLRRADRRLNALGESSGVSGFAQRAFKGQLQQSERAASAPSFGLPAPSANAASPAMGGVPFGGGGMGAMAGDLAESAAELSEVGRTMRQIGNRVFYRRDGRWVDATVTESQERQAVKVKQFSDAYFDLARRYGRALSPYMAMDEAVLVGMEGRAYLIEP